MILPKGFFLTVPQRCIYLADDDEDDDVFFEIALRECLPEYQYCHFDNGSQLLAALHQASHPHPDVIFMDVEMPVLNGPDTYNALRAMPKWADIPVCLVTSSPDLAYTAGLYKVPLQLLHIKPVTFDDMKALILSQIPAWQC